MRVSIAQLQAAGMTDSQIVNLMKEREAERREQNRKAQINHRARQHEGDLRSDIADPSLLREVEVKKEEKKKRAHSKTSLPTDWQPKGPQRDPAEADEFRTDALAHGRTYANWDAAFLKWQRSQYNPRNKNASPPISNGKWEPVSRWGEVAARTLREREEREREAKRA